MPGSMQGVQMVAQSPLRHDAGLQPIESYHHQSWKRMPDYPSNQHEEINHNTFPSIVSIHISFQVENYIFAKAVGLFKGAHLFSYWSKNFVEDLTIGCEKLVENLH